MPPDTVSERLRSGRPEEVVGSNTPVKVASGEQTTYAFLDNATSTPAMVAAVKAVNELLPWYASVHRGAGIKSRVSTCGAQKVHPGWQRSSPDRIAWQPFHGCGNC